MAHSSPRFATFVLVFILVTSVLNGFGAPVHAQTENEATATPTSEPVDAQPTAVATATEISVVAEPTETASTTPTVEPTITDVPVETVEPPATSAPATPTPSPTPTALETETSEPEPSATDAPAASPAPDQAGLAANEQLTIHKIAPNGQPLTDGDGGACFVVIDYSDDEYEEDIKYYGCDGDDGDNDGTTTIAVPVGKFGFWESRPPKGYFAQAPNSVTIVAGGPNELTVTNAPLETLTVFKVDENGNPLTDQANGACFRLQATGYSYDELKACDVDDGARDGKITFRTRPGTWTLKEVRAPNGYVLVKGSRNVTIVAGGTNEVTVTNVVPEELTIFVVDEHGDPLSDGSLGACFRISERASSDWQCDSEDGAHDGTIKIIAPVGPITLVETYSPEGYRPVNGGATGWSTALTIVRGGPNTVTIKHVSHDWLTVFTVDERGNPLTDSTRGACYSLDFFIYDACDRDDGALDGRTRLLAFPGTSWVEQTRAPVGYLRAKPLQITIISGGPNRLVFVNRQMALEKLTILTVDEQGKPVTDTKGGACFKFDYPVTPNRACDRDDGRSDGRITLNVVERSVSITETREPDGYVSQQPWFYFQRGRNRPDEMTIVHKRTVLWTISKVDEQGDPITDSHGGACFEVFSDEQYVGDRSACDGDDGARDGKITMHTIPGTYQLYEFRAPAGFALAEMRVVTVAASGATKVTVSDVRLVEPPVYDVTIHLVDADGDPITDSWQGACIWNGTFYVATCDRDDGANDGLIVLHGFPAGPTSLVETRVPLGYHLAESRDFTVVADGPNEVTFTHASAEILTVLKIDEQGNPAKDNQGGACFILVVPGTDNAPAGGCDDQDGSADGTILLTADPGTYELREVRPPSGYMVSDQPLTVTVVAGGPNEVTVPNMPLELVTVLVTDEQGVALTDDAHGACFILWLDLYQTLSFNACDGDDGVPDGRVHLRSTLGERLLQQYAAPDGYLLAEDRTITVVAGGPNDIEITNALQPKLTVYTIDVTGKPVTDADKGACYAATVYPNDWGSVVKKACDADDGANDGKVWFSVPPGDGELSESRAPAGYYAGVYRSLHVSLAGPNEITIVNYAVEPFPPFGTTPPPTETPPEPTTEPAPPATTPTAPGAQPTPVTPEDDADVTSLPNTGGRPQAAETSALELILVVALALGLLTMAARIRRGTTQKR